MHMDKIVAGLLILEFGSTTVSSIVLMALNLAGIWGILVKSGLKG